MPITRYVFAVVIVSAGMTLAALMFGKRTELIFVIYWAVLTPQHLMSVWRQRSWSAGVERGLAFKLAGMYAVAGVAGFVLVAWMPTAILRMAERLGIVSIIW